MRGTRTAAPTKLLPVTKMPLYAADIRTEHLTSNATLAGQRRRRGGVGAARVCACAQVTAVTRNPHAHHDAPKMDMASASAAPSDAQK